MREYTVRVEVHTTHPVTDELLETIAAIGGAASGVAGGRDLTTTLTMGASDLAGVLWAARARFEQLGRVVSLEATEIDIFDLREGLAHIM
jgi:hypothetical protein